MKMSLLLAVSAVSLTSACLGAAPLDIGDRLQLPWDDFLSDVGKTTAPSVLHHPEHRGAVFDFNAPWEGDGCDCGTVVYDGRKYRLYYLAFQMGANPGSSWTQEWIRVCCIESNDGVNWERPDYGLHEFRGSRHNNIVINDDLNHCLDLGAFYDTNSKCPPDERYKIVMVWRKPTDEDCSYIPLYTFVSADGADFRPGWTVYNRIPKDKNPVEPGVGLEFDTHHACFWDPVRGEYRIYTRGWHPRDPKKRSYDGRWMQSDYIRDVRLFASDDFRKWDYPREITYGPGAEDCHMYTSVAMPYSRAPEITIGLPVRYTERPEWDEDFEKLTNPEMRARRMFYKGKWRYRYGLALTDCLFMFSRDGRAFFRVDEAFLRPGPERRANWVYGNGYAVNGLVETQARDGSGPELTIYYTDGHWMGGSTSLERYAIRLDGFMSRHAGYEPKRYVTKELVFSGEALHVNFSTAARGYVKATIRARDGRTAVSTPAFGDSTDRTLTFREPASLSALSGVPVVVEFELSDADLYSFRFGRETQRVDALRLPRKEPQNEQPKPILNND